MKTYIIEINWNFLEGTNWKGTREEITNSIISIMKENTNFSWNGICITTNEELIDFVDEYGNVIADFIEVVMVK